MQQSSRFDTDQAYSDERILAALRIAMLVHAFLDLAAAIALFFTPSIVAQLAPDLMTEPFTLRIIAGAFTAIAYASALASMYQRPKTFMQLLRFKAVWSTTVWLGLIWSIVEFKRANNSVPTLAWLTLAVFITGSCIWNTFNLLLTNMLRREQQKRAVC